jgi:hypothetical protein
VDVLKIIDYNAKSYHVFFMYFFKPKYDFYFLKDLIICTPNKTYFLYFFEMRNVIRKFGKFLDFNEERIF